MRTSQVSCPHCESTLTFGEEIAAGSAVPCLICMQTFVAEGVTVSETPDAPPPPSVEPAVVASPLAVQPAAAPIAAPPMVMPEPPPLSIAPPPPLPNLPAPTSVPAPAAPKCAVAIGLPAAMRAAPPPPVAPAAALRSTVPTRPNRAPVVVGGLVLGGMALFIVVGLGVISVSLLFSMNRASRKADPLPVSVAQHQEGRPTDGQKGKPGDGVRFIGGDDDVASIKQVEPAPGPGPLTERIGKDGGEITPPLAPVVPVTVVVGNVPGVEQQRIDAAIEKGVRWLKDQQAADGTWGGGGHRLGYAALAGLTLLECHVPANDPHVAKAAHFVRNNVGNLNATYELSLAILFLDRLGNPKDQVTIQGMALRLLGGQNDAGGWTYHNHLLSPPDMKQLLVFLKSHRPDLPRAINQPAELPKQVGGPDMLPKQARENSDDPFKQLADLLNLPKAAGEPGTLPRQDGGSSTSDSKSSNINKPIDGKPSDSNKPPTDKPATDKPATDKPAKGKPAMADKGKGKKLAPIDPNKLAPPLQNLPVVALNAKKGKVKVLRGGGDNSNTQFALLGLWAARRQDVPVAYSLQLAQQRFQISHNPNGGWGYHMGQGSTNTMTCVGLIGLAMGHGALAGADIADGMAKLEDPAIQKGLRALGQHVGTPSKDPNVRPAMQNLYFLWSVERVAMLYDLKTIGGKDWYGWGAQTLLPNQSPDGHWQGSRYPGSGPHTDTCFALLFLKRSNLVPDLTENLRLHMVIRDPEAK